jgi:hypothetical protein
MSVMPVRISRMGFSSGGLRRAQERTTTGAEGLGSPRDGGVVVEAGEDVLARRGPGLVNRGQEAAGGAIERVSSVLPGCVLTESCQSLHVAPDRTGIRS